MMQSSVKSTRYVSDGEVDPSMAAMVARAMRQSKEHGETFTEMDAWLFASRFGGFDARMLDSMTGAGDASGSWVVLVFVNKLKVHWEENRGQLQDMELSPEVIEALLFLHGDVKNWPDVFEKAAADGLTTDDINTLAKNVASSVPPLGKKWLRDILIKDGTPVADAEAKAANIYAEGGNLLSYEAQNDRRKAIAALLRLRDPKVTDEQIERVVKSPMTLDQVKDSFGGRGGGPRSGSAGAGKDDDGGGMGVMLLLGAAALAAFFFMRK
jgi:hypothetical protein